MRDWLIEIRKREGKTQQAVARAAGISQPHYANIEKGTRGNPLNPLIAQKIGKELNFDWRLFYDADCDEMSSKEKEIESFEQRLSKHLQKCEIEFCAKEPHGHCVDWFAEYCDTVEHIALKLRELGFKIKRKVDEEPWAGEIHRWVETSSGIIVYVNTPGVRGLVAKRSR